MKNSGIYKIQSKCKPDRIYIGSAVNIPNRWSVHLLGLRKGKHHSILLQRHVNKYGINDLNFSILEYCSKKLLIKVEQQYLNKLDPFFNIAKSAGSPMLNKHHSIKTRRQMSKSRIGLNTWTKGRVLSKEHKKKLRIASSKALKGRKHSKQHSINNGKARRIPVVQLNMNGVFIKEWDGTCTAQKKLSLQNINACLKGRAKSCGGFKWKYKNK